MELENADAESKIEVLETETKTKNGVKRVSKVGLMD